MTPEVSDAWFKRDLFIIYVINLLFHLINFYPQVHIMLISSKNNFLCSLTLSVFRADLEIEVDYCTLASINGLFGLRSTGQFCILNVTLCFFSTSNLYFKR